MGTVSRAFVTQLGAIAGVALVAIGLWLWGVGDAWSVSAERKEAATWAIRCFAIAAIGAGQVVFALVVLPGLFAARTPGRNGLERIVAMLMGLAALLALVAGAALAAAAGW